MNDNNATNLRVIREMKFEIRRIDEQISKLQSRRSTCQSIIEKQKKQMQSNDDERHRQIEQAWSEYYIKSRSNSYTTKYVTYEYI